MPNDAGSLSRAGERLLEMASDVFYAEGIRATGVDTLTARAGVSKPTLYAQFGSKRELVARVLERRHEMQRDSWVAYLAGVRGSPVVRLLSVFDWLAGWHASRGQRGCAFLNAAAEIPDVTDPARPVIAAHKRWLRDQLTELARLAGLPEPAELGESLLLLVDGANARVSVEGDLAAAARAKRAAAALVAGSARRD